MSTLVNIEYGAIQGQIKTSTLGTSYRSFTNIPYMKPPIGDLKFADPQQPVSWTGTLDCTKEVESYCTHNPLIVRKIGKESAAVINVYVPNDSSSPLPILVNIHGGGFQTGSSKNEFSGPDYWMERNVILVTFNYRLGPLGFLSLKDPSLKVPGNAGLKDQVMALKWIQKNIVKFGGDPQNVTIYGESAGAVSVHLHMLSDQSKWLFHKAIMVSGSAFDKSWSITDSRNDFAERLAKKCGWDGIGGEEKVLEILQKTDSHKLMKLSAASNFLTDEEFAEFMIFTFTPVVEPYDSENCFIPKDPQRMAQNAWSKDIPCMIGAASLEGAMCNFLNRNKNYVELLQDPKFFTPSREMKISAEKAAKYGKIIRNIYFDEKEIISMKNVEKFLAYAGDRHIWHGVYNAIKSRAKCENTKTFAFYFDADTELNMMKRMAKLDFEGAAHADFGMYIFSSTYLPPPQPNSIESKMIEKLTKMIESFMLFGIPNAQIDGIEWSWKSVSGDDEMKCLVITERKIEMLPLPVKERMEVWNSIYVEENIKLF